MEYGLDFPGSGRPLRAAQPEAASAARFDWHGISARLSAVHALRRAMTGVAAEPTGEIAKGSFDPAIARLIAHWPAALTQDRGFHPDMAPDTVPNGAPMEGPREGQCGETCFQPVNPVTLADRKTTSGIHGNGAGKQTTGDRGLT